MEEDGGRVDERRDGGRTEEERGVWLGGFLSHRRIRRDLCLIGWTRLWLLRRWATMLEGPVPVLLKGCSDLDTKKSQTHISHHDCSLFNMYGNNN